MLQHEIIKKLLLTEESYRLVQEDNTFMFKVDKRANKIEIKKAVEASFGVKVLGVTTSITSSKSKTIRGKFGQKVRVPGVKKAFIKVRSEDLSKIPLV
jgi:large subunit ribosomal protein L23